MRKEEKKQSFLEGALLLSLGVLSVKVIGALYKVPLAAVISEEGMGYFGTAYSFYNVLFSVATAGLPVAVSRAVSAADAKSDFLRVEKIRRTALPLFFLTGLFGFVFLVLFAPPFFRAVKNPGAVPALICLSPSVLFCGMSAAYRGYFEGRRNMVPTAVSQIIEAFLKLIVGLSAAIFVMRSSGVPEESKTALAAAAAISGVTVGSLLSFFYLWCKNKREEKAHRMRLVFGKDEKKRLSKQLLRAALPVSLGAVAVSVSGFIDASFLQTRLLRIINTNPLPLFSMYAGCIPGTILEKSESVPNYLFGCYNMALTLFMLVPSVTQAFAISALPNVSAAVSRGDRNALKRTVETVLRITLLFALPAGLGLSALAEPVTKLIYGERMASPVISAVLSVLGIAAVFSSVTMPLTSMLQAAGKTVLPVLLTTLGLILKIILNYILVGLPEINLLGGAISTLISTAVTVLLLYRALCRVLRMRFRLRGIAVKPLFASLLCVLAAKSAQRWLHFFGVTGRLSVLPCIFAAVLFYAAALLALGAVTKADIATVKHR